MTVFTTDELQIKHRVSRINRLARQALLGAEDAAWLESWRSNCKLHAAIPYPALISQLQDIFGLQLVAARLTA